MEVHHHPDLHHKPKRWKEYFLEFLMIFLAVTLGFFAENIRESTSEHNQEVQYAQALYTEFHNDSIVAANKLSIRIKKLNDLDYLNAYLRDSNLNVLSRNFYPSFTRGLFLMTNYAFQPLDGILNQLISTGSMRYFKEIDLQKLLGEISVCIKNVRARNDQEYMFWSDPIKPFLLRHCDFNWLNRIRANNVSANSLDLVNNYQNSLDNIQGTILNLNSFDRTEASNIVMFLKQILIGTQTLQLHNYIVTNHKILDELRKDYSLKN